MGNGHMGSSAPPAPREQTGAYENITSPQLRMRGGNKIKPSALDVKNTCKNMVDCVVLLLLHTF